MILTPHYLHLYLCAVLLKMETQRHPCFSADSKLAFGVLVSGQPSLRSSQSPTPSLETFEDQASSTTDDDSDDSDDSDARLTIDDLSEQQREAYRAAKQLLAQKADFTDDELEDVVEKTKLLPKVTSVDVDIFRQVEDMCFRAESTRNPPDVLGMFGLQTW